MRFAFVEEVLVHWRGERRERSLGVFTAWKRIERGSRIVGVKSQEQKLEAYCLSDDGTLNLEVRIEMGHCILGSLG